MILPEPRTEHTVEDLLSTRAPYVLVDAKPRYAYRLPASTRAYDKLLMTELVARGRGLTYEQIAAACLAADLHKADMGRKPATHRISAEDVRKDLPGALYRTGAPLGLRKDITGIWRVQLLDWDEGIAECRRLVSYSGSNDDVAAALMAAASGEPAQLPKLDDTGAWALLDYLRQHPGGVRTKTLLGALEIPGGKLRALIHRLRMDRVAIVAGGAGYEWVDDVEAQTDAGRAKIMRTAVSMSSRTQTQQRRVSDLMDSLRVWYREPRQHLSITDRSQGWSERRDEAEDAEDARRETQQITDANAYGEAKRLAAGQLEQYADDYALQTFCAGLSPEQMDRGIIELTAVEAAGRLHIASPRVQLWLRARDRREWAMLAEHGWLPKALCRPGSWHDLLEDKRHWRDVQDPAAKRQAARERQAQSQRRANVRDRRREAQIARHLEQTKDQRSEAARLLGMVQDLPF